MRITEVSTFGPDVVAFLDAHVAQMRSISPPESKHALDLDGLRRPGIAFWTVLDEEGALLGCGALAEIGPGHAELKSMRTDPARRRGGIATALLTHIVTEARLRGHRRLSLETGSDPFFAPARALREARLRPVPAVRLVPPGSPQHLHDARPHGVRRLSGPPPRRRTRPSRWTARPLPPRRYLPTPPEGQSGAVTVTAKGP